MPASATHASDMPASASRFRTAFLGQATPEDLEAIACVSAAVRPKVNAHIHLPPNFSAFESTRQAVKLASDQQVRVLGASNYYDYAVYNEFADLSLEHGILPLFGIEIIVLIDELVKAKVKINDPGNPGKMYICGKGISKFDPLSADAAGLLQVIRDADSTRMDEVVERLAAVFASAGLETGLTPFGVKQRIVDRHQVDRDTIYLQERHAAQAFQEVLFEKLGLEARAAALDRAYGAAPKARPDDAVGTQNEIRAQLMKAGKAAYVAETFVDFDHAYRLILALGGIPAYPVLADGASPICPFEDPVDALIDSLRTRGIHAVEFIPIRNSPAVLSTYVHTLRAAGFFVTAGTEHNTLDLLPIEPTCLHGEPIPEDIKDIFWEGACVVMAHQYLTMSGKEGFVDASGNPNAQYASSEERIEAFRRLGAGIYARYRESGAGE